jgi:hypothetical protein
MNNAWRSVPVGDRTTVVCNGTACAVYVTVEHDGVRHALPFSVYPHPAYRLAGSVPVCWMVCANAGAGDQQLRLLGLTQHVAVEVVFHPESFVLAPNEVRLEASKEHPPTFRCALLDGGPVFTDVYDAVISITAPLGRRGALVWHAVQPQGAPSALEHVVLGGMADSVTVTRTFLAPPPGMAGFTSGTCGSRLAACNTPDPTWAVAYYSRAIRQGPRHGLFLVVGDPVRVDPDQVLRPMTWSLDGHAVDATVYRDRYLAVLVSTGLVVMVDLTVLVDVGAVDLSPTPDPPLGTPGAAWPWDGASIAASGGGHQLSVWASTGVQLLPAARAPGDGAALGIYRGLHAPPPALGGDMAWAGADCCLCLYADTTVRRDPPPPTGVLVGAMDEVYRSTLAFLLSGGRQQCWLPDEVVRFVLGEFVQVH